MIVCHITNPSVATHWSQGSMPDVSEETSVSDLHLEQDQPVLFQVLQERFHYLQQMHVAGIDLT